MDTKVKTKMYKISGTGKSKSVKKIRFIATTSVLVVLLVLGGIFFINRRGEQLQNSPTTTTKTSSSDEKNASVSSEQTIDYSEAGPDDTPAIPDKQVTPTETIEQGGGVSVAINSTRKNTSGTIFMVKATVIGSTEGTCTATLKSGSTTLTTTTSITLSEGQYICQKLEYSSTDVDKSDSWDLTVDIVDKNGAQASIGSEVIL